MAATDRAPPLRILVADDERAILESYREVLMVEKPSTSDPLADLEAELFGADDRPAAAAPRYAVTLCSQGQQAVDAVAASLASARPYDVALLDMRMPPGIDGIRAAEQIRAMDPAIGIAIVTGYSDVNPDEIRRRVAPVDRLRILVKPFDGTQIEETIADLVFGNAAHRPVEDDAA